MRIVVLDGFTLNPGDLSWEGLQQLGEVAIYERTPPELIVERAGDAEIVLTNKTPLRAEILRQLSHVRYIGVLATGYDVVDVKEASERGIVVTNVPGYSVHSVAQMTFALLLELCHQVTRHSDAVKAGDWSRSPDFCFWHYPQIELADKTIGILGYGSIGRQVAQIAIAFGMKVVAFSPSMREDELARQHKSSGRFVWGDIDQLLEQSDVLSLHCPLTPETAGIVNSRTLARMKKSAVLINTSRGKLIDAEALADALNKGVIAGAAVDVLEAEPPDARHPLIGAANCLITPHIAWASGEARARLMQTAADNIRAYAEGAPINVVNLALLR